MVTMREAIHRLQEASRPYVRAELQHSPDAACAWLRKVGERVDPMIDRNDVEAVLAVCKELEAGKGRAA